MAMLPSKVSNPARVSPPGYAHRGRHGNDNSWVLSTDHWDLVEHLGGVSKATRDATAYLHYAFADIAARETGSLVGVRFRGPTVTYSVNVSTSEWQHVAPLTWFEWCATKFCLDDFAARNCGGCCGWFARHKIRVVIPADINNYLHESLLRLSQEKLDGSSGSQPVQTAVRTQLVSALNEGTIEEKTVGAFNRYCFLVGYLVSKIALGRAVCIGGDIYYEPSQDDDFVPVLEDGGDGQKGCAGPPDADTRTLLPNRDSEAEMPDLRRTVRYCPRSEGLIAAQVERDNGRLKAVPPEEMTVFTDDVCKTTINVRSAPFIVEPKPSFGSSRKNEELGIGRHLRLKSRGEHTAAAYRRFLEAVEFVQGELLRDTRGKYFERVLPKIWSRQLKEEVDEKLIKQGLQGFNKLREAGLDPDKLPRLIGDLGPEHAAATAYFASPLEQYLKSSFPGAFFTKGKTTEQVDAYCEDFLNVVGQGRIASCDFSAMDSSWTLEEKKNIYAMCRIVAERVCSAVDNLGADKAKDPRAHAKGNIVWRLRFLTVSFDVFDAILFSGERPTSLFNRLLVLILRTAEVIRLHGVDAASQMWENFRSDKPSATLYDLGDGDDTAFDAEGYKDANEITVAYREYNKYIEPVIARGRFEVLSRYHHKTTTGRFFHLNKLRRNVDRLLLAQLDPRPLDSETTTTPQENAQIALVAYNRAIACCQVPFLRHFCLHVAEYHYLRSDKKTRYRQDDLRLEDLPTIDVVRENALSSVNAEVSGKVMTCFLHFATGPLSKQEFEAASREWMEADRRAREVVLEESHFLYPQLYAQACGLTPRLLAYMGEPRKSNASRSSAGCTQPSERKCPPLAPASSPAAGSTSQNVEESGVAPDGAAVGESDHQEACVSDGLITVRSPARASSADGDHSLGVAPQANTMGVATGPAE